MTAKEIEALWALVIKVPESISYVLIEHLPEQAGLSPGIPQEILEQLTPKQLETLLYRRDIELKALRHEIFAQPAERLDGVRCAAISSNFDLSYDDFSEILAKPSKERIDTLRDLAVMAGDLSLVFYEAIHDILSDVDTSASGAWREAEMAKITFERKTRDLTGWQRTKQLRELRLYRLAKQAVPWRRAAQGGCPPRDELEFLVNLSVKEDTWTTFMNYSSEWATRGSGTERLENFLPRISEIDKDDIVEELAYDIDISENTAERIKKKVAQILASISSSGDENEASRMSAFRKFVTQTVTHQEKTSEGMRQLEVAISQLRATVDRQRGILYVVLALLAWLSFR